MNIANLSKKINCYFFQFKLQLTHMEELNNSGNNYVELFGFSPKEQECLFRSDHTERQLAIENTLNLLAKNLHTESLKEIIRKPSDIFGGISIIESLTIDPETTLEVIKLSFDQSSTN